jgi:predicted metal-dependent HD superfamily phosphohydrolase
MEPVKQMSEAELASRWRDLAAPYGSDVTAAVWEKLRQAYTETARPYHNLTHIGALLDWAERFQAQLQHYDAVRFAIWFHDAIYDTHQYDNEERSAALAGQQLQRLNVPADTIRAVEQMILATKTHQAEGVDIPWLADTRWFLDFDLSILGSPPAVYRAYSQAIRREYGWVPDPLYRRGRRQVLEGFLMREQLFLTEQLRAQLEAQARANLRAELAELP